MDDLDSVEAVAAGGNYSLALKENGQAWSWGSTLMGKRRVERVEGLPPVVSISAGGTHAAAVTEHIAPRGAKKEEAFGGVILKSERPSGALFTNSGPPFFTVESKIEVLSPLGTSFH